MTKPSVEVTTSVTTEKQGVTDGLLPHEQAFVFQALGLAVEQTRLAREEFGDTVANSGGDWIFDDPASQAAMNEHGMKKANEKALRQLSHLPLVPLPTAEDPTVVPGSRVVVDSDGFEDKYDIVTRRIPGFPTDPEVFSAISASSEMGQAMIGTTAGETIEWTAANGKQFTGRIAMIDQEAQRDFYTQLGLVETPAE